MNPTRWLVIVRDCQEGRTKDLHGASCLDTYVKGGFPTIEAARAYRASHPCVRCLAIADDLIGVLPDMIVEE